MEKGNLGYIKWECWLFQIHIKHESSEEENWFPGHFFVYVKMSWLTHSFLLMCSENICHCLIPTSQMISCPPAKLTVKYHCLSISCSSFDSMCEWGHLVFILSLWFTSLSTVLIQVAANKQNPLLSIFSHFLQPLTSVVIYCLFPDLGYYKSYWKVSLHINVFSSSKHIKMNKYYKEKLFIIFHPWMQNIQAHLYLIPKKDLS